MSEYNNFIFPENTLFSSQKQDQNNQAYYPFAQSPARVTINLKALGDNFLSLKAHSPAELMPVIKADAYGHGLVPCALALKQAGAKIFAVGTVQEGALLRQNGIAYPIVALLGLAVEGDYDLALQHDIIPLITGFKQLSLWQSKLAGLSGQEKTKGAFGLKFDTGMRRLGFCEANLPEIIEQLKKCPTSKCPAAKPFMVVSHLAVADEDSGEAYTQEQMAEFNRIVAALKLNFPELKSSLLNSAGILAYGDFATDIARPGLALYGANPLAGTQLNAKLGLEETLNLKQVMQVAAPVLQVHALQKGQSISYGRTFTAPKQMQVAIIAAGYAQGFSRGLSNKGMMLLHGSRVPVLGRVCMQLTAVDVSHVPGVKEGDFAWLLGGEGPNAISANELASAWGTIPYEVFCIMGTINGRYYF